MSEPNNKPDLSPIEKRKILDDFLVNNSDLEILNAKLAEFNIFRVLKIENAEIRHSNILAWLLSPGESHGLGDMFLRKFLSTLLMENYEVENFPVTPSKVELMHFNNVEVLREWLNIDIVVSFQDKQQDYYLIIENKIRSKESPNQLIDYKAKILKENKSALIIPVLLTLEGDDPSDEAIEIGYIPFSHSKVCDILKRFYDQNKSRISHDAGILISHYITTLRRLTMGDEEIVKLCRQIYSRHKNAIDLISEFGGFSQYVEACTEKTIELMASKDLVLGRTRNVWFLTRAMQPYKCQLTDWNHLPSQLSGAPIMYWYDFDKKGNKFFLRFEVGPIADYKLRSTILSELKKQGFGFIEKQAFKEGAKYTRFYTTHKKLVTSDSDDGETTADDVKKAVESLWKKASEESLKVEKALKIVHSRYQKLLKKEN